MLIISCKAKNHDDMTIDIFKPRMHRSIICLTEEEAQTHMKNFYEYKCAYNKIKENNSEDRIVDEQAAEIFYKLKVDDFSSDSLHTLIVVNDHAK